MPATAEDIVTLGAANMQDLTKRTAKSGRDRYTIDIKGDSFLIDTDPKSLGRPIADAIAEHLRTSIQGITAQVSPATKRAREAAQKALSQGKAWALKRYGGGRIGTLAPNTSDRFGNDSGRLAQSIAVGATKDGYAVNVAANRFDATTFGGGEAAIRGFFARLAQYVPELADPSKWLSVKTVRDAVSSGLRDAIVKAEERAVAAKRQLMQARIGAARAFLSLVA